MKTLRLNGAKFYPVAAVVLSLLAWIFAEVLIEIVVLVAGESAYPFLLSRLDSVSSVLFQNIEAITAAFLLIGLLVIVVGRFARVIRRVVGGFALSQEIGLLFTHLPVEDGNNWEPVIERSKSQQTLWIMGATGWATFARSGDNPAPLHDLVEKFNGEIRIMLIDPCNRYLQARATSVGMTVSAYIDEIAKSIEYCFSLKNKAKRIHVRLYGNKPVWKLIIAGNFAWVQHYINDDHVAKARVVGFVNNRPDDQPMFGAFWDQFDATWESLDTVELKNREDWEKKLRLCLSEERQRQNIDGMKDLSILQMIKLQESETLEFKETLRYDVRANAQNASLENEITKTIAAFANTAGGVLLIGVSDDMKLRGLKRDYDTFKSKDRDSFLKHLSNLVVGCFGQDFASYCSIDVCEANETGDAGGAVEVCRVIVRPCREPKFVTQNGEEILWVRVANTSRKKTASQIYNLNRF